MIDAMSTVIASRRDYPAPMREGKPDRIISGPVADELIIEFPDDPEAPILPDIGELTLSVDTHEPPDTHDIRERWARLAQTGGGG